MAGSGLAEAHGSVAVYGLFWSLEGPFCSDERRKVKAVGCVLYCGWHLYGSLRPYSPLKSRVALWRKCAAAVWHRPARPPPFRCRTELGMAAAIPLSYGVRRSGGE